MNKLNPKVKDLSSNRIQKVYNLQVCRQLSEVFEKGNINSFFAIDINANKKHIQREFSRLELIDHS